MSHFVLRTADFDRRHRIAEFETMAARICKLAIDPSDDSYASSTSIAVLSDVVIASTVHSPCKTRRTAHLAAETGDNILLHIPLSGGFTIRQERGTDQTCQPGQIYLDPSEVPGLARFTPVESHVLYVSVPRASLMARAPGLAPDLRQVSPVTPQWRLLIAYAKALHAEAAALPPEDLQMAARHIEDLLVQALGADREAMQIAKGRGTRAARLRAIKADIDQNLTQPDLGSAWLAGRHGLSDRYIRSLFAQEGTSLPDYIAARRLDLVHRDLTDPRQMGQTISQIATSHGFGDLSWFNAQFRARFGATPSDIRAQGQMSPLIR